MAFQRKLLNRQTMGPPRIISNKNFDGDVRMSRKFQQDVLESQSNFLNGFLCLLLNSLYQSGSVAKIAGG